MLQTCAATIFKNNLHSLMRKISAVVTRNPPYQETGLTRQVGIIKKDAEQILGNLPSTESVGLLVITKEEVAHRKDFDRAVTSWAAGIEALAQVTKPLVQGTLDILSDAGQNLARFLNTPPDIMKDSEEIQQFFNAIRPSFRTCADNCLQKRMQPCLFPFARILATASEFHGKPADAVAKLNEATMCKDTVGQTLDELQELLVAFFGTTAKRIQM